MDDAIDKVKNPGRTCRNFEKNLNAFEDKVVEGVVDSSQSWLDTFDPEPALSPTERNRVLAKTGPNRRVRARNKRDDEVFTEYRTAKQKRLDLLGSGGASGGATVVATKALHPQHAITHSVGTAGDGAKLLDQQVAIEVYEAEPKRRNLSTETNIDALPTMWKGAERRFARTAKGGALSYTLSPITDPATEVATKFAAHHYLIPTPLPAVPTLNVNEMILTFS
jgi:hypothetical protein